jgi:hypothetical protein
MPLHKELRQVWKEAGYASSMGSAAVVRPPPAEYKRVYYLTSAEYAVSSIALRRMKLARFSDVNDPFELMALNFREQRVRKVARDFKSEYDSHTGLLCFSADWTDPVLWSHYGAKHHGVCLGFNLLKKDAQQVKYKDERILSSLDDSDEKPERISKELQKLLLCTKFRHWEYEKETRIFVRLEDSQKEGNLYFRSFGKDLELAEVILGPQSNLSLEATKALVLASCPKAVVFKARLAYKFFKVVPQESTVP